MADKCERTSGPSGRPPRPRDREGRAEIRDASVPALDLAGWVRSTAA
jgi:hypothetical protein